MKKMLSRRSLLKSAAGLAAAGVLAACEPKVVEKIVKETVEVEKIVKETVEVEKVVKETVVVEKVVKETVIVAGTPQVVEKQVTLLVEKVVTTTPVPAGELKGEVITVWKDSDWWLSVPGQRAVALFNDKYPHVELIGIGAGGDSPFVQKVTTMFVGGTPPDLMGGTPGRIIALATEGDDSIAQLADDVIRVPDVGEELQPFVTTIPLQLLAYHIADLKGTDVDQPRNLAKSVTVE